ncbi:MAG TPA: hypothetical protein VMF06_08080 [Candidatus Limnocylindria bacterium]|jgi:DNA-binding beta-propeller fold protein YncE|nr:hypothetical protein [Candidatus Limnocylindria bacterium]
MTILSKQIVRGLPSTAFILSGLWAGAVSLAGEFSDMAATFGTTLTLSGTHQDVTTNPDGTSIDFWVPSYEGAPATAVSLSNPHIASADVYGNVYIADKYSHAILRITPDGLIHTFAGTHQPGFNGDGPASATTLQLSKPNGLFVLADGTVYLLDPGNQRIRRVDRNGTMTTVVVDADPRWMPSGRALWVSPDESLIYYTHEYTPVPPLLISDGAVVKKWTRAGGIELVCDKTVGFRNPGNIAVNPVDGKLYVTDRAEEDASRLATGLFRIDGVNQRTRMTGNVTQPQASDKQVALNSFIEGTRGIAFRADGSYFLCGHKDGDVWFVDTSGVIHRYLRGSGKKDNYMILNGQHPPLQDMDYFAQPRAVTLAPNGDLLVVSNDSGFVFKVNRADPQPAPIGFHLSGIDGGGAHLSWEGVFGYGYRLESSPSLSPPAWVPVGAVSAPPQQTHLNFNDPSPGSTTTKFYRLLPSL